MSSTASEFNDTLLGNGSAESFDALGGDDLVIGGGGDDAIDGGTGVDTAQYLADFVFDPAAPGSITTTATGWQVASGAAEDTDQLENVEIVLDSGSNRILLVGNGGFTTIQEAVDAAADGDTILIAAGTYAEQVIVDGLSDIHLIGVGSVTVVPPAGTLAQTGTDPNFPTFTTAAVLTLLGGDGIVVDNIDIDGESRANDIGSLRDFVGIAVFDSGATLTNLEVSGIRDPLEPNGDVSGLQRGNAIVVSNLSQKSFTLTDSRIDTFQKTGLFVENADVTITGNTIVGEGAQPIIAQNGAQLQVFTGTVSNNTIEGIGYTGGAGVVATALFVIDGDGVTLNGNTLTGAAPPEAFPDGGDAGLYVSDSTNVTATGNTLTGFDYAVIDEGFADPIDGTNALTNNTFADNATNYSVFSQPGQAGFAATGTDGPDQFYGDVGDDTLSGLGGEDTIDGGDGNDSLTGSAGDDALDGGAGSDTASYAGNFADYSIVRDGADVRVIGDDGEDILSGVEYLQFTDRRVALVDTAGGNGFATIQAGINAASAGDTVLVLDGDYEEATVTVDRAITLLGANAGVAGTGTRGTESNLVGKFILTADGVTVDGFRVTGSDFAIQTGGSTIRSDVTIANSIFEGQSDSPIRFGLGSGGGIGSENWSITDNMIDGMTGNARTGMILFNITGLVVTGNTIRHDDLTFTGRRGINLDGVRDATISGNDIDLGLVAPTDELAANTAAPWIIQISMSDRTVENVAVDGNTLSGARFGVITLNQRSVDGVTITHNDIDDTIHAIGLQVGAVPGTGTATDVTVTDNTLSGYLSGIRFGSTIAGGSDDAYSGLLVQDNAVTVLEPTAVGLRMPSIHNTTTSGIGADGAVIVGTDFADLVQIASGTGTDSISGGLGSDTLAGAGGGDTLEGDAGNDSLSGGDGDDLLLGGAEDDTLEGAAGADSIDAGFGNDVIAIAASAEYVPGDTIDGGTGIDTIAFTSVMAGQTLTLLADVSNVEVAQTSLANSATIALNLDASAATGIASIVGNDGANALTAGADAQTLTGNGGADTLTGGAGNDTIQGGAGNDTAGFSVIADSATIAVSGGTLVVTSADGIDTLTSVEALAFNGSTTLIVDQAGVLSGYTTIGAAIAAASAISGPVTILVAAGTYAENVTIGRSNLALLSLDGRATTIIDGLDAGSEQGAIQVLAGQSGVTIGAAGQGFTIRGINGNGSSEKAAIYLVGNQTGITIAANELVARGDSALTSEFGGAVTGLKVDGNIFSGQTFAGTQPGTGGQFDLGNNVPRQLVVLGNGPGNTASASSGIVFTNNAITGTAGGLDAGGISRGNTLVTIDASGSLIEGNIFSGFTAASGYALRVRRPDTDVIDNTLDFSAGGASRGIFVLNESGGSVFSGNAVLGGGAADVIFSMTPGGDSLDGAGGNDVLIANAGDDTLLGGGEDDVLLPGLGIDLADGGAGNDRVEGTIAELAPDTIAGGSGTDTIRLTNTAAGSFTPDADVTGIEAIEVATSDALGGAVFTGTAAVDVDASAISGLSSLTGNAGANLLTTSGGGQSLFGNAGNDTLNGGGGNDALDGGSGIDTATYAATVTLTATGTAWTANDGTDTDTLVDVEIVQAAGIRTLLVGSGGFASIQAAVDAAIDGDTILIPAGTFTENVTIGAKAITLRGFGEGVTTIAGQITVNGVLDGPLAFEELSINAAGFQYGIFASASSTEFAGGITLNGVAISNAGQNGFAYIRAGNGSTPSLTDTVGSISILNSAFTSNGITNTGAAGRGDVILFGFNRDVTIADSSFSGVDTDTQKAIQLRGTQTVTDVPGIGPYAAGGTVSITDNDFTGTYAQDLIAIYRFAGFASFTGSGNTANVSASFGLLNPDSVGGILDLTGFFSSAVNQFVNPVTGVTSAIATPQGLASADDLTGTTFGDVFNGRGGADTLEGGGGADLFIVATPADHAVGEVIDGGAGIDTIAFAATIAGQTLTLLAGVSNVEVAQTSLTTTATIALNLDATAATGIASIVGNDGDNALTAGEGAQTLTGNAGADTLIGGGGNDTMIGGADADRLEGGLGDDRYVLDGTADTVVELLNQGLDTVEASIAFSLNSAPFANVENLFLGGGTAGLQGTGNALANVIQGNAGANRLEGLGGNDTLIGGAGRDTLVGGGKDDRFLFNSLSDSGTSTGTSDLIAGFVQTQDDRIDVSAIDAIAGGADDAFVLIGNNVPFTAAGQVRYFFDSGRTIIQFSTDADVAPEMVLRLNTTVFLTNSDFVF